MEEYIEDLFKIYNSSIDKVIMQRFSQKNKQQVYNNR